MTVDDLDDFLRRWNHKFPIDRLWREKHKVAFLSKVHQETSFIHQLMDMREDLLFLKRQKDESKKDPYIPNIGDIYKAPPKKSGSSNESLFIDAEDIEVFRRQAEIFEKKNGSGRQKDTSDSGHVPS